MQVDLEKIVWSANKLVQTFELYDAKIKIEQLLKKILNYAI
jgi:hypothetical protein